MNELWYPYRWGLKVRKVLLKLSSSYGSRYIKYKRPFAVFLSALLDDTHQETYKGTPHYKNRYE